MLYRDWCGNVVKYTVIRSTPKTFRVRSPGQYSFKTLVRSADIDTGGQWFTSVEKALESKLTKALTRAKLDLERARSAVALAEQNLKIHRAKSTEVPK